MSDQEDIAYLQKYIDAHLDRLNLKNWIVKVSDETILSGWSEIDTEQDQRRATIKFGYKFYDSEEEEQRDTIAHELLHLHLDDLANFSKKCVKTFIQSNEPELILGELETKEELLVDALSRVFSQVMEKIAFPGDES